MHFVSSMELRATRQPAAAVLAALRSIYSAKGPLHWPSVFASDPGPEFRGPVEAELTKRKIVHRVAEANHHRSQAIVENWNRTLAQRLYSGQYSREYADGKTNHDWSALLPRVVADFNKTKVRTFGKSPVELVDVLRKGHVPQRIDHPSAAYERATTEAPLPLFTPVHVRIEDDELPGKKRRATDPYWHSAVEPIVSRVLADGKPPLYYVGKRQHGYTASMLRVAKAPVPSPAAVPTPKPATPKLAVAAKPAPKPAVAAKPAPKPTAVPAVPARRTGARATRAPKKLDL